MEKSKLGKNAYEIIQGVLNEDKRAKGFLGKHVEGFSKFFGQYLAWNLIGRIITPILTRILLIYIGWKLIFKPLAQAFGWMQ